MGKKKHQQESQKEHMQNSLFPFRVGEVLQIQDQKSNLYAILNGFSQVQVSVPLLGHDV